MSYHWHLAEQLYEASHGGSDKEVLELLQRGAPPNNSYCYTTKHDGVTPLHRACADNRLCHAVILIKFGAILAATNKYGSTPLHLACLNNSKATAKLLLKHHCPTGIKNISGQTAADWARLKGHRTLANYVEGFQAGPRDLLSSYPTLKQLSQLECDQWLQLGVCLGLSNDQLETIKTSQHPTSATLRAGKIKNIDMQWKDVVEALVSIGEYKLAESVCTQQEELEGKSVLSVSAFYGCVKRFVETVGLNPKGTFNKASDTPLSLACANGHLEVIKYLIITLGCATNDHLLLPSVKGNQNQRAVEYLLVECHCDPNVTDEEGKTPLDLANDSEIIKLLLKHGAKAANVYKEHSKLIGKLSSERPPHLPLFVLIIGDGGVGKSTLLKSILSSKGFWALFQKAKPVDGVDARTVGIIPYEEYTKEFGRIIYFDFAGQKEFYTSHCAILENAVQTSPPIIILCAKLVESEQAIVDSMNRWLTLVQNQCTNLKGKAHVIVVGSHADQVNEMGEDPRAKEDIFAPIIKEFPKFEFIGFIPMDCRFADSNDMNSVRKHIQKSSAILRSPETISLNAHTFYIYLAETFKDELAVSLKVVQQQIHSDLDHTHESEKIADIISFIPTTLPHLVDICNQLSKTGLLLFLHNKSLPENSFLVCDSKKLLSDVTGTVFAPKTFRQHCDLASSTGVVPFSKFSKEFDSYDIEMLIDFITHLELCFEIKDKQVLEYIQKMEPDLDDTRYLFFPGLIKIETPERVWEEDPSMSYHFGWIIECAKDIEFFDPRSFQILILRLVFTFCLAPSKKINTQNPALQKFCSIWKSGICWCDDDGITTHLELCSNKFIALKMRSEILKPESLAHRSKIVKKILETVKEANVFHNIKVVESLINPQEVVSHPLKPSSELTLFSVIDLAVAVTSQKEAVKSVHRALSLKRLLQFEPYASLDLNTLQCIHSDKNTMKDDTISNIFISHFARQMFDPNCILMYRQILSQYRVSNVNIESVSPRQQVVQALETWRSETGGTYSCLRETLNKYSVFTGRNPLDLADVAHDDIDSSFVFSINGDQQKDHDTLREEHSIPSTTTLGPPANQVTLQELIKQYNLTNEQLDSRIEVTDTPKMALCFDNVRIYSSAMGLAPAEQADVKRLYHSEGTQVAMMKCLKVWKQHNPSQATYRALLDIVLGLGKGDTADQISQQLT